RGGGGGGGSGAVDQAAELLDSWALAGDPLLDGGLGIALAAPLDEVEAELLEVAGQAGGEQPLPLVAGREAGRRALRPVERESLAEPRIGVGQGDLVDSEALAVSGD